MFTIQKLIFKDRFIEIYLDNEEKFYISYEIYQQRSFEKDQSVDEILYQFIQDESEKFQCYQKALSYLAIRNRSTLEIENYLKKKQFSGNIIKEIIIKLKENKYVSDYEFAVEFIQSKIKKKTIGKNLIKRKLNDKGITRETIKKAIEKTEAHLINFDEVYELAIKKYGTIRDKPNATKKLEYFLFQRGFDWDVIKKVIHTIKNNDEYI